MENNVPQWLCALDEEDVQFLKRLLLASGSLKALAEEYEISYPTVRSRLDRLIEKVAIADDPKLKDPFQRQLQLLLTEGQITVDAAKKLMRAHKQSMQELKEKSNVHEK